MAVEDQLRTSSTGCYAEITRQYHARYRLPVMHTETNLKEGDEGDEAVKWLWKEGANVFRVRNNGVPIVGVTWYSLTHQVDWDTALLMTSTGTSVRSVERTRSWLRTGARSCLPRVCACVSLWCG